MSSGIIGSLIKGAYVAGGAVGSRWLTQVGFSMVGLNNSGWAGYLGNAVAGYLLATVAGNRRLLGSGAKAWILGGTAAGIVLRFLQDQTSFGKMFSLSGMGDPGVGVLLPSAFVDPPLFTGQGAGRRIPPAWAPAPMPSKAGMGWSTYGVSTYR